MSGVSKKEIHPYFRDLMDKKGWRNAAEVGRAAGIPDRTAQQIVHGERFPTVDTANKIARAAGVDAAEMLATLMRQATKQKLKDLAS